MEVRSVLYQEPFRNETKGPLERTNVKHGLIMIRSNYLFSIVLYLYLVKAYDEGTVGLDKHFFNIKM